MVFKLQSSNCCLKCFQKGHNAKIIQARVIVLVLCILTHDVLYLCKVSRKYLKQFSDYRRDTVVCNVRRGIAPKLYKPELWFLHSAYCLMMFYICVKFHQNIINGIQVTEQKLVCNVQRDITPKLYKPGLCFLHSAICFISICVKFHKKIWMVFKL